MDTSRLANLLRSQNFGPNDSQILSAINHPLTAAKKGADWFAGQVSRAANIPRVEDMADNPYPLAGYTPEQQVGGALNLAGLANTGAYPLAPKGAGTLGTITKLPENTQTSGPEFKNWFGNSKIIDDNGNPLMLYHGTNANFDVFDPKTKGDIGFHFGNEKQASQFAKGNNSSIKKVYLSAQNPLEIDFDPTIIDPYKYIEGQSALVNTLDDLVYQATGKDLYSSIGEGDSSLERIATLAEKFDKKGKKMAQMDDPDFRDLLGDKTYKKLWSDVENWLKSRGHDSIIYENQMEGSMGDIDNRSYIVFDPTQIKSATSNTGKFDKNNPNILAGGALGALLLNQEYNNGK